MGNSASERKRRSILRFIDVLIARHRRNSYRCEDQTFAWPWSTLIDVPFAIRFSLDIPESSQTFMRDSTVADKCLQCGARSYVRCFYCPADMCARCYRCTDEDCMAANPQNGESIIIQNVRKEAALSQFIADERNCKAIEFVRRAYAPSAE